MGTYGSRGWTIIPVRVFKPRCASQVHARRQCRQNDLSNSVAASDRVFQDPQVAIILDRLGYLGTSTLDLITGDLEHLVAIFGSSAESASAASNRLVAEMGGDETIFVLLLDWGIEEALHELESLLLVAKHAAAIDALASISFEFARCSHEKIPEGRDRSNPPRDMH